MDPDSPPKRDRGADGDLGAVRAEPEGGWAEFYGWIRRYRFLLLLIFLVTFMLITPLFELRNFPDWPLNLAFAFVVIAAVNAAAERKITTWVAVAIAIPALVISGIRAASGGSAFDLASDLLANALLALTIVVVLRHIVSRSESNLNVLSGAAALYLLLAVAWALVFRMIDEQAPGAFSGFVSGEISPWSQYLYFSLTTLTTLGYGDISPVHPFARILSTLEAVTGLLYVAILISRLVGLYRR